jgi:flagellar biosynthesis repressor protein FlbT
MKRRRRAGLRIAPDVRRFGIFLPCCAANALDTTAHLRGRRRVNQLLTLIGKDRRESARKHRRVTYLGRDFRTAVIDRRRQNAATENNMALKVELKPHERIIIGSCVITNTDQRARLLIDGDNIPILREKDILTPETADTPAKLIYLAVQLMYISPDARANHGTYFNLIRDLVTAVPSAWPLIEGINNHILNGDLYLALKETKKLVAYEKQLLDQIEEMQSKTDVSSAA